jgi:hypothetical protein
MSKPNGTEVYGQNMVIPSRCNLIIYSVQFKQIVYSLVEGKTDQISYEDNLRKLLGANSYTMFTAEKLVSNIIKVTLSLISSQLNQRLIGLYAYEHARAIVKNQNPCNQDPLEHSALTARLYLMNCCAIIGHEDHCVQIEYFKVNIKSMQHPPFSDIWQDTCDLGIGYLDNLSANESKPSDPSWQQYLDRYLTSNTSWSRPYLRRNVRPRDDTKVFINNGLESKICRRTFKVGCIDFSMVICFGLNPFLGLLHRRNRRCVLSSVSPSPSTLAKANWQVIIARFPGFYIDDCDARLQNWWQQQPASIEKSLDAYSKIFSNPEQTSETANNMPSHLEVASSAQPMDLSWLNFLLIH